jgi:hypothetical protein
VLVKAQSVDEIKPYLTKARIAQVDASKPDEQKMLFGVIKMLTPQVVHVESESIDGDSATLKVDGEKTPQPGTEKDVLKGIGDKQSGTVTMQRSDGTWKVDKESWKGEPITIK